MLAASEPEKQGNIFYREGAGCFKSMAREEWKKELKWERYIGIVPFLNSIAF